MKILWVNPSFLDYRIPVYKKIYNLKDLDFFLIYSQNRVPERIIHKIENAIGDHAIGLLNEKIFDIPRKNDFANTDIKIPFQPGLYKAISKVDADIYIGVGFFQWTPLTLIRAKLKRKKILIEYERTSHTERNCPIWRRFYRVFISKFVDGFLVNGQLSREYLIQLGVNEQKIFIVGMSADNETLIKCISSCSIKEKETLKSQLSLRDGLVYLYVGGINEPKGVIFLLNAWKRHIKEYEGDTLLIVGTGPLYKQYAKDFSNWSSIKLIGGVEHDLMYLYYSIADVFIIPTLEDNWSLVVPEAMICGLPIACSIYNGCYPELVHEGINGKLFDPLKEEKIIETLIYFHTIDLKRMGRESTKIVEKYSADYVTQNIYNACKAFE